MAIVKMSQFSLFAFDDHKEELLKHLQRFEYVHFSNLEEDKDLTSLGLKGVRTPEGLTEVEEQLTRINSCIETLSKYFVKETGLKAMKKGQDTYTFAELEEKSHQIDSNRLCIQVRDLWKEREGHKQAIDKLMVQIGELKPWKGISSPLKDLDSIRDTELFIGTVPRKLKEKVITDLSEVEGIYYEVVDEDKESLYLLVMSYGQEAEKTKELLRNSSFTKAILHGEGSPSEEITILESKIALLQEQISEIDEKLKELAPSLEELKLMYDYLSNKKLRLASTENFVMTEKVNVIKGFIPSDKASDFEERIKEALGSVYYLELEEVDKDDPNVPILLKNSDFASTFESLTSMYALPQYNEVDPTPLLAPFYLIFFGMMAADVGYGLIMLIGSMFVLKNFNLKDNTRMFLKFFYYLSFSVIIWGFIYGSLFGGIIPLPGIFDPAEDYNTLLILSIAFGLIHIYFALGIKAYKLIKSGKPKDALYDVGFWYMALTGSIVYLLNMVMTMPPILKTISLVVMVLGMLGIVATGGREAKSVAGRVGGGVYALYGISGYVGDFVSYSRLMALGLAGGFIAGAVNMMAGMVAQSGPIGFVFAIIIFIFGQTFNLGLSLLGAYVHTIRLTFVEFFGKFYEGGGKSFNTFKSKPKYINLK
ncbi:MAG TPA: V-type ATP synthase subunit I [Gudongella oleilytica]|jgi:V/A-type H+-transporting ATPase subunit I|nr:V-type ATP synthase subunit I [Gudongella oleilytica]